MLEFHPLANLFPLIEGRDFDELVADVRANGLQQPIVMFEDKILDGRNRYRAAVEADLFVEDVYWQGSVHFVRFQHVPGDLRFSEATIAAGPLAYVLSLNLYRRHLNSSQLAMLAADLGKLKQGRPGEWRQRLDAAQSGEENDKPASLPDSSHVKPSAPATQAERAELVGTSERNVRTADFVKEHAAPEVTDAVRKGDLAVSAAAALAKLSVKQQLEILRSADPRALARVAKERRAETQGDKKQLRAAREIDLAARQAALPDKRYGVILADPEWRFEPYSRDSGMDRAADNHYPTSSLEAIKARPVADIAADDCVLFLWATVPMLPQALEVMAAWGFDYKSHTIWRKADRKPSRRDGHGGLVLGTGYWFRNAHELLLVGTRGAVPAPAMGMQHASMFDAPPLKHSAKPVEAYELIESYFPTLPKIELNAREARAGWDAWGFEAPDQASESTVETPLAADVDGGISPAGVEVDRDRQLIPGSHSQEADPAASPAGDQEPGRRSGDEDGHHLLAADLSDDPRADYRARVAASGVRPGGYSRDTAAPILRAAYATDPVVPTKQIAADLGHPIGTILTWASREGLTKAERRGGPDRLGQARAGAVA